MDSHRVSVATAKFPFLFSLPVFLCIATVYSYILIGYWSFLAMGVFVVCYVIQVNWIVKINCIITLATNSFFVLVFRRLYYFFPFHFVFLCLLCIILNNIRKTNCLVHVCFVCPNYYLQVYLMKKLKHIRRKYSLYTDMRVSQQNNVWAYTYYITNVFLLDIKL